MALPSFETSETTRPSTRRHIKPESSHHSRMDRMDDSTTRSGNPPWPQAGKQAPGKPNAVNWSQFLPLLDFRYRGPSTRISGAANNSANCQFTKVWTHATYPSLCQSVDRSVPMTHVVSVPWMCIPFLSSLRWNVPVRWISSNMVNCRLPHGTLPAGRPAGTVSIAPLERNVLNSPHIWHTCTPYPVSDKPTNGVLREAVRMSHGLTVHVQTQFH